MPSGNWSVPTSPRNPAKIREELRVLAALLPSWRLRGMAWGPRTGTQLEFGRALRQMGDQLDRHAPATTADLDPTGAPAPSTIQDAPSLPFQVQAETLSDDSLRWTARARFGTYKFFGFVMLDGAGRAALTPAGERLIASPRPREVFLRQLLKWQYPDHQHRGRRYPPEQFALFPFRAVAWLIRELGGLTKEEMGLFCFTLRRMEDRPAVAQAIAAYRRTWGSTTGRVRRKRLAQHLLAESRRDQAAAGLRVAASMDDYADALARYFRYTGLFSVRGLRLVVAGGREADLDELLAQPADLFPDYDNREAFYAYYGAAAQPELPWEHPTRLQAMVARLHGRAAALHWREFLLRTGQAPRFGTPHGPDEPAHHAVPLPLTNEAERQNIDGPADAAPLATIDDCADEAVLDRLWREMDVLHAEVGRLEMAIDAIEARTPERLAEALHQFEPIIGRRVIDPPTFLEWNAWRVFVSLDHAQDIRHHLQLDADLQPLSPAPGNVPDLEVTFEDFVLVVEVTLRRGADQRHHETRPVTRHVLDVQRRVHPRPVFGLFLAPRIHPDTATDFFVALKYRVIERTPLAVIPLTIRQFVQALHPFAITRAPQTIAPPVALRSLCEQSVAAALAAATGDEWLARLEDVLTVWLGNLGSAPAPPVPSPRPLPLFEGT